MGRMTEYIREAAAQREAKGTVRSLTLVDTHDGAYCTIEGKRLLNLASNDYLGIATDSFLYEEFCAQISAKEVAAREGVGSTSSRLLSGTTPSVAMCESALATHYGTEAALLFSSGYHANIGVLTALCDRHDVIFSDKLNHASIVDGQRLTRACVHRYQHRDMEHLRRLLAAHRTDGTKAVIISETLFSMDGDRADIPTLVALAREYDATLILDEAHAVGVYGKTGRGCAEEYADVCAHDDVLIIGTGGKALAGSGGFLVASSAMCTHVLNTARTFIYTTAPPPLMCRWLTYVITHLEDCALRRRNLHSLAEKTRVALTKIGAHVLGDTHILPVVVGDTSVAIALSQALRARGFFAPAIRPPTVPNGTARVRLSLTAAMTDKDMAPLIAFFQDYTHEK